MSDETLAEIFSRLSETEAHTREQNVRLDSLSASTAEYVGLVKRAMDNAEKREANFWKIVSVLAGALVALALGPKVATELFAKTANATSYYSQDILPNHNDDFTKHA